MNWWRNIEFANPEAFWLLALVPLLTAWHVYSSTRKNTFVSHSNIALLKHHTSLKYIAKHFLFALEMLSVALISTALARPQSSSENREVVTEGIDIVISLDISGSMLARDFQPNRLEASRELAKEFIEKREHDRIGLVIFAGEAFTQCPLTTDHAVLKKLFNDVDFGMVKDGTAIGSGLAVAVNRLRNSEAESKVVILLTDGENNAGDIPPLTAAEIAQKFGITVYTVGVGTTGTAPMPARTIDGRIVYRDEPVHIDEETLKKIADITDGKYFRAQNSKELQNIYALIDEMEKTKIDVIEFSKKKEEYLMLAVASGLFLLLSFLIKTTILRSIV